MRKSWDERLFAVVWFWIAFRTIIPWLVTYRLTLEGGGYMWGSDYFGHQFYSSGLTRPDFLLIYALLAVGIFLLVKLRQHRFKLAAPLVLVYLAFFAADALYQLIRGERFILEGTTLGLRVNLTIVFFILMFGMFAVAIAWWFGIRDLPDGPGTPPLSARRKA